MPARSKLLFLGSLAAALLGSASAVSAQDIAGAGYWDVSRESGDARCRIVLRPNQSDSGNRFAAIPGACRHALPILGKVGRWSLNDTDIVLREPGGAVALDFTPRGDGFVAQGGDGATYRLTRVAAVGRSAIGLESPTGDAKPATIQLAATKKPVAERQADLAGRYAILRDKKHDTGCMLTLDDRTQVKGGDRAALAPACRDQGIVVFDPVAWQIVAGRLVLTAKAGHVTHLDRQDDGTWLKDPAEGKSLSLKKL